MRRVISSCLAACIAGTAAAQTATLVDPTRPPNSSAESAASAPAARSGPQLQSVLISPSRRVAVISGTAVSLGARYGDATVAGITEGAVLLRYANRVQTLQLIPGVAKRERRVADAAASDKGNNR